MGPVKMIPILLDKPRHILLNMQAVYRFEQELAKVYGEKRVSLPKIMRSGDLSMTELLHLIWAGLLHEEPTLTIEKVSALIATVPTRQIDLLLGEALREQAGGGAPAEDPTMAPSGIGSGSGVAPASSSTSPTPSSGG